MNVQWDTDIRQTAIHTAEPVLAELSVYESEVAI